MGVAFASIPALLLGLNALSIVLEPSFGWYLFCGFCLALSVIAPGMSFSTLLMPLGLYTPFVDGLGHLNMGVLIPGGLGAIVTVICLAKGIDCLFKRALFHRVPRHYGYRDGRYYHDSAVFHVCSLGRCAHHQSGLHCRRHRRRAGTGSPSRRFATEK